MIFPDDIARWLDSPGGSAMAADVARTIFGRPDDLADFEIGVGAAGLPSAIERELDRLITDRDAERNEHDA